jgi:hypothetical protein
MTSDLSAAFPFPMKLDVNDYVSVDDNTAVFEVSTDRDVVAAVAYHDAIDCSDN